LQVKIIINIITASPEQVGKIEQSLILHAHIRLIIPHPSFT
jgi:hypothetical protein